MKEWQTLFIQISCPFPSSTTLSRQNERQEICYCKAFLGSWRLQCPYSILTRRCFESIILYNCSISVFKNRWLSVLYFSPSHLHFHILLLSHIQGIQHHKVAAEPHMFVDRGRTRFICHFLAGESCIISSMTSMDPTFYNSMGQTVLFVHYYNDGMQLLTISVKHLNLNPIFKFPETATINWAFKS